MGQRTILLMIGLLIAIVAAATTVDLFAPASSVANPGFLFGPLRRPFDRPATAERPVPPWEQFNLPRTARSLAAVATFVGYGLLLWYLVPQRTSTLVRVLLRPFGDLVRYGIVGLALLVLLVILTLLAAISLTAIALVPLFSIVTGIALLTGLVLLSIAIGQRLRILMGDSGAHVLADLVVGLLAVMLFAVLPVVGTIVTVGCGAIGLGAMVMTHFGLRDQWRPEALDY